MDVEWVKGEGILRKSTVFLWIILLTLFLTCKKNPIPSDNRTELEKVKDYILGKWVETKSDVHTRTDLPDVIFTRELQFGMETFKYESADSPDYHELIVNGTYTVDNPEQLSIMIVGVPQYGSTLPFIIQIPQNWEAGDMMFWEIQSITRSDLILCFEPNVNEPVFHTFSRPD